MMHFVILLIVGVIARQAYGDEPEAIIGGQVAGPGQFPHQISLQMNGQHMCGGSIISPTHIVTAAHCIPSQSQWGYLTIVTGTNTWRSGGQRHQIKCIQVNPGYNGNSNFINNDIAVITVAAPIQFNNVQRPIGLASRNYATGTDTAIVSGWGKTHINSGSSEYLKFLQARVLRNDECQRVHGAVITSNQICIFKQRGEGACHGDSGGPLISGGELIGVVSWGTPCAVGNPDVFTNVLQYRGFIQQCQQRC